MTKEQKKQLYGFGLPIILGTILLLGVSYAWFQLTLNGTKTNVLQVESLSLELDDEKSVGIDGDGIVPMLDEVGLEQDPYRFTLINKGNIDSDYTIYLDDVDLLDGENKLSDGVIKYNLKKDENELFIRKLSESVVNGKRVLDTGRIGAGESYVYDLRMWIDYDATKDQAAGKTFRGKIHAEAQQVIEQPPTPEECFAFDGKGTITKYLCGPEIEKNGSIGTNDNSPIGRIISDVVIPKKIRGVDVVNIGYSSEECESNDKKDFAGKELLDED